MANLYRLEKLRDSYPQFVSDIVTYTPKGMEFETTSAPGADPVALPEVKTFLNVNHTDHDSMINGFIGSATKKIEDFIHRSLISQEITAYWRIAYGHVFLPRPPHISITSVKKIDDDGNETTISSSDYDVFGSNEYVIEFDSSINDQLEIVYQSGYGANQSDVPQDLQDAVKWQIKLYYATSAEGQPVVITDKGLVEQAQVLATDYIYNYPGE